MSTTTPKIEGHLLNEIKEYLKSRKDVAFAFLYGSYSKGNATSLSDVDIAVYFHPQQRHPVEFEEERFYDGENEVWGHLQEILRKEVELLVLNRVPASVAASAIRGIPLAMNDWGLYLDFMEIITDVAEDFEEFIIRYYKEINSVEKRDQNKTD
jgi:predicted nucleotidyltransferase